MRIDEKNSVRLLKSGKSEKKRAGVRACLLFTEKRTESLRCEVAGADKICERANVRLGGCQNVYRVEILVDVGADAKLVRVT